jgi:hypothetical protein
MPNKPKPPPKWTTRFICSLEHNFGKDFYDVVVEFAEDIENQVWIDEDYSEDALNALKQCHDEIGQSRRSDLRDTIQDVCL